METIKKLVDEKFDYFNRWLNNTRISDDTYTMIYKKMYELQNEIKKIVDEKIGRIKKIRVFKFKCYLVQ